MPRPWSRSRPFSRNDTTSEPFLAVGDPRRPAIRAAIAATSLAALVFSVLTGPVKQVGPLYGHAPWLNDPFDTVISFAMFFVPFIAACCLARVSLCRRSEPLPLARAGDLLRGCCVVLAAVTLTLLAEWISVAIGGNRAQWDGATWLQVGFLATMTGLAGRAAVATCRAWAMTRARGPAAPPRPDWLADMVLVAERQSRWLGPLRRPALGLLRWLDVGLLGAVRRHPLWLTVAACAIFGVLAGVNQGIREGYRPAVTLLVIILLGCGMFALLVMSGSYLGLVRGSGPRLLGMRRRAVDAATAACAGVLAVFAFRYHLWWIVGARNQTAGLTQLTALLAMFAFSIFVAVIALESLLSAHADAV